MALVRRGVTVREAAAAIGIPGRTLETALQKLRTGVAHEPKLRAADQALMALTYQIASEAQQRVLAALPTMDVDQQLTAASKALRAIGSWRKWSRPDDTADAPSNSRILDRLEAAIASGASLSLSVTPPAVDHTAIDVTPRILRGSEGAGS